MKHFRKEKQTTKSEKIWLEYKVMLQSFIRGKGVDAATCDDILQTVFLKMHTGLTSLQDEKKLKSWLFQITRNVLIDHFRSQKPTVDISEKFSYPEPDFDVTVASELSECLGPMIQSLPGTYREAIILSELQGLPLKEVASLQGTSLSGTKSRVQRGRALLKNMLTNCCRLEFDQSGRLYDFERKSQACILC